MLTGLLSLEVSQKLSTDLEDYRRGGKALGEIRLGKTMSDILMQSVKELGANTSIEMALAMPIAYVVSWLMKSMGLGFSDALNTVVRIMTTNSIEETQFLIKALKRIGGEVAILLDRVEITEKRVLIEGLKLYDVFSLLSRVSNKFEFFVNMHQASSYALRTESYIKDGMDLNSALAKLFLEIVKDRGVINYTLKNKVTQKELVEVLRIDMELRKKGVNLENLMPYVLMVSLYLVMHGY